MQLIKVCQNVWIIKQTPSNLSLYNQVTTIIRLQDDSLLVYNPFEPNESLVKKINHLGEVKSIIVPSCLRCSYLELLIEEFPKAIVFIPNKIPKRALRGLDSYNSVELKEGKGYPWDREVDFMKIDGMPLVNESILFHKKSNSLILSDLLVAAKVLPKPIKWISQFFLKGKESSSLKQNLFYQFCIRNTSLYKQSLAQIKEWNIKRVVLSRGGVFNYSESQVYESLQLAI